MNNVISEDNHSLNLHVMSTTCHMVIILEDEGLIRKEFLVNFQTRDYRVFTGFYILSL